MTGFHPRIREVALMTVLRTQTEAFEYAKNAGFGAAQAEVMSAIAMAETLVISAGKPFCDFGAIGDTHLVDRTWGPSYGAWQVRSILKVSDEIWLVEYSSRTS